jgi:hypothetical protein
MSDDSETTKVKTVEIYVPPSPIILPPDLPSAGILLGPVNLCPIDDMGCSPDIHACKTNKVGCRKMSEII